MNKKLDMAVDSETVLYAVLGSPINHSLSPLVHNTAFRKHRINAVYLAFEVDRNHLVMAFEALRALGMGGANLTIPLKEEALKFVDEVPNDTDRCIGAINTIVQRDGKLIGYNTDRPGFLAALKEDLNWKGDGKKSLVAGAGGAGRAVLCALAEAGAKKLWILNRTRERADGLCQYLRGHFPKTEFEVVESAQSLKREKVDLAVNATACGMGPNDPLPFEIEALSEDAKIYDLVYSPAKTALLKAAERREMGCANGLGMLAVQAALSFELWTGQGKGVHKLMRETLQKCRK